MDVAGVFQALASTFVLGILFQAVFVVLVVYVRGHHKTLLQDRRRLVLIAFLSFAALWAQFAFVSFFLRSKIACHVTAILSAISDQAARATVSGLLLWIFAASTQSLIGRFALRGLIGLRIALGGVFAGFTGPQLTPLCVAKSRNFPIAIAAISFDAAIACVLGCCIYQRGLSGGLERAQDGQSEGFPLALVTFGFFVWSSMSIPSQLGSSGMSLVLRVAIPGIGLLILLGSFPSTKSARTVPPEAPTLARGLPGPRPVRPLRNDRVMSARNPLHANPVDPRDATPQAIMAMDKDGHPEGGQIPNQTRAKDRERSSGSVFRSIIGAPLSGTGIVITGDSTLPVSPKAAPISRSASGITRGPSQALKKQKSLRGNSSTLKISGPVSISGPSPSIKTIDLAEAAELQRRRQQHRQANQDRYLEAGLLTATRKAPDPPSLASAEALQKRVNFLRRGIAPESPNRRPPASLVPELNESDSFLSPSAVSGSLQLKGSDEMRRRSPRTPRYPEENSERVTTMNYGLPSRVKLARHSTGFAPPISAPAVSNKSPTVIKSGLSVISAVILAVPSPSELPQSAMSIMERKGPNVDKRADRTIFPRRESHLQESLRLAAPFTQQPEVVNVQMPPRLSAVPTAATKLESLILESTDGSAESSGVEHKFPAPPSSLPLPRFTEFSVPQIPSLSGSPAVVIQHSSANDDKPSPLVSVPSVSGSLLRLPENARQSITQRGGSNSPSSRGSVRVPPGALEDGESQRGKAGSETRRQSDTVEQTTGEGSGTLGASGDDFEMEIPIKLGYDVRSVLRSNKWHYRVGDTTPMFSESRRRKGSNKMPPPVPLPLQSLGGHTKAVGRSQDGSAIERTRDKELWVQEDMFGSTDRESVGSSVGRSKPDSALFRGRKTLLERLEWELNLEEQDWLQLQEYFSGSSASSTTWDLSSHPSISPNSTSSRQRLSNVGDKQFRFKSSNLNISISAGIYDGLLVNDPHKHFSEPPGDYLRKAPNKGLTNFLTIDNYRVEVSPTPPESEGTVSDMGDDMAIGFDRDGKLAHETESYSQHLPACLWRMPVRQQVISTNLLWEAPPPEDPTPEEMEPPARNLRPARRRPEVPLRIFSSRLWTRPEPKPTKTVDLWGQIFNRPKCVTPSHTASQKPLRKTKRITFLPDIVENPEPLPGKSGALGIFQGPWGPTDSAWPPILRLPPTVTTAGTHKPRATLVDADDSSFYDDHDDDDFDEEAYNALIDDVYSNSGGDGIEDPVVWELLGHRRDVLGGGSVFPLKSVIVEDDYDDDDDDDDDGDDDDDEEEEDGAADRENNVHGDGDIHRRVEEVAE